MSMAVGSVWAGRFSVSAVRRAQAAAERARCLESRGCQTLGAWRKVGWRWGM